MTGRDLADCPPAQLPDAAERTTGGSTAERVSRKGDVPALIVAGANSWRPL